MGNPISSVDEPLPLLLLLLRALRLEDPLLPLPLTGQTTFGSSQRFTVGELDGKLLGMSEGILLGMAVGKVVGVLLGTAVGEPVGDSEGASEVHAP